MWLCSPEAQEAEAEAAGAPDVDGADASEAACNALAGSGLLRAWAGVAGRGPTPEVRGLAAACVAVAMRGATAVPRGHVSMAVFEGLAAAVDRAEAGPSRVRRAAWAALGECVFYAATQMDEDDDEEAEGEGKEEEEEGGAPAAVGKRGRALLPEWWAARLVGALDWRGACASEAGGMSAATRRETAAVCCVIAARAASNVLVQGRLAGPALADRDDVVSALLSCVSDPPPAAGEDERRRAAAVAASAVAVACRLSRRAAAAVAASPRVLDACRRLLGWCVAEGGGAGAGGSGLAPPSGLGGTLAAAGADRVGSRSAQWLGVGREAQGAAVALLAEAAEAAARGEGGGAIATAAWGRSEPGGAGRGRDATACGPGLIVPLLRCAGLRHRGRRGGAVPPGGDDDGDSLDATAGTLEDLAGTLEEGGGGGGARPPDVWVRVSALGALSRLLDLGPRHGRCGALEDAAAVLAATRAGAFLDSLGRRAAAARADGAALVEAWGQTSAAVASAVCAAVRGACGEGDEGRGVGGPADAASAAGVTQAAAALLASSTSLRGAGGAGIAAAAVAAALAAAASCRHHDGADPSTLAASLALSAAAVDLGAQAPAPAPSRRRGATPATAPRLVPALCRVVLAATGDRTTHLPGRGAGMPPWPPRGTSPAPLPPLAASQGDAAAAAAALLHDIVLGPDVGLAELADVADVAGASLASLIRRCGAAATPEEREAADAGAVRAHAAAAAALLRLGCACVDRAAAADDDGGAGRPSILDDVIGRLGAPGGFCAAAVALLPQPAAPAAVALSRAAAAALTSVAVSGRAGSRLCASLVGEEALLPRALAAMAAAAAVWAQASRRARATGRRFGDGAAARDAPAAGPGGGGSHWPAERAVAVVAPALPRAGLPVAVQPHASAVAACVVLLGVAAAAAAGEGVAAAGLRQGGTVVAAESVLRGEPEPCALAAVPLLLCVAARAADAGRQGVDGADAAAGAALAALAAGAAGLCASAAGGRPGAHGWAARWTAITASTASAVFGAAGAAVPAVVAWGAGGGCEGEDEWAGGGAAAALAACARARDLVAASPVAACADAAVAMLAGATERPETVPAAASALEALGALLAACGLAGGPSRDAAEADGFRPAALRKVLAAAAGVRGSPGPLIDAAAALLRQIASV